MIKNWRLTTDVTVMIKFDEAGNKLAYLTPPEKKYEASVSKLIDGYYNPITIENKNFSLSIESDKEACSFSLYITSPNLPSGMDKCRVMNFDSSEIWNIFEQNDVIGGKISGDYYAVFSDATIDKVSFVSTTMKEYKSCNDEMRRRISCEFFKKTKKIVFGHRYDSIKETRYYLCEVNSRKENETHTQFLDNAFADKHKVYLYVNNIKDTDTNISQILSDRCFGSGDYDIKVAYDSPTFVDSGSVLNNDFSGNIKDYWKAMFNNAVKACTETGPGGYIMYKDLKKIFDIFAYQNDSDMSYMMDKEISDKVTEILSTVLKHNVLIYWKVYNVDSALIINEKKDFDKNTSALMKLFYKNLVDPNLYKELYYTELFRWMNISLQTIARNVLISWDENNVCNSFENFLKYRFFYENKQFLFKSTIMNFVSNQRKNLYATSDESSGEVDEKSKDLDTISTLFGGSELSNVIIDLYEYANSNYGLGVETYNVFNCGTKVKPDNAIYCKIVLDDIINYKKGIENMSENLKNEIIKNKFNSIVIVVSKSEKIK